MGNRFLAHVLLASGLVAQTAPTSRPASVETTVTIEGQVIDLRGEPVPLAEVWIADWREPLQPLAHGICDGEGIFRVARVPQRDWWTVRAGGEGRCKVEVNIPRNCDRMQVALHDAVAVRGQVRTRSGKSVAGAHVYVDSAARALTGLRCETVTDAEGKFLMPRVPLGPMRFAAIVPGEGLAEFRARITKETEVQLAPGSARTTSITFALEGVPAAALPDVQVEVLPYLQGSLERFPRPWSEPRLGANGTLALELLPDRGYYVSLRCAGFAISPAERKLEQGKGPHVAKFAATPLASQSLRCRARVVGANGKPLAGVRLTMRPYTGIESCEATSDGEGELVFESPVTAGTKVVVESRTAGLVVEPVDEAASGGPSHDFITGQRWIVDPKLRLELRVVSACTVSGRLLRSGGEAAAMVAVELEGQLGSRPGLWRTLAWSRTDREGRYRFTRLNDMPTEVRVHALSAVETSQGPSVPLDRPGQQVVMEDLLLSPSGIVEGVVRSSTGAPAPGIRLELRDWNELKAAPAGGPVFYVVSDRSGRFRFTPAPTGYFFLRVAEPEVDALRPAIEPFEVQSGKPCVREVVLPE